MGLSFWNIGFETLASSISKYIDAINHKLQ
jgi:hypothetical protein